MIQIKNISKKYGDNTILNDISFGVPKGQIVGIVGFSGSGKSTLLRCIQNLEKPTSGSIITRGKSSMIFQQFCLFNHMTVMQNITYAPLKIANMPTQIVHDKAHALLRHFGLQDKCHALPSTLSGGQKQRASLIRALMIQPDILLCDEPTSALDPCMTADVLAAIQELANDNMTLMIVSHELRFLQKIADRILFFDNGNIIEDSDATTFFTAPKTDKAKLFLHKEFCHE